ncbi:MAG: alpha/beta fold hydrolase [Gemmatimonadota bacterium]|nr:MAG: alpha/beta fold hydrolase [Gemmatimonadota bacterium]
MKALTITVLVAVAANGVALAQSEREGHTLGVNGFEMYYETVGSGDPLLILHGWSGTCHDFDPFVQELADHYRLILPDVRGHGRSTNPSGEFTIGQSAEDVLALLDQLGVETTRAIGASMGGITLLHMAARQPARIEAMAIVGAGSAFLPHCRESMASASADSYPAEWWTEMRRRHTHGDEQIAAIAAMLPAFAANETDVAFTDEDLSQIAARTLIVHGDRDWCFPVSMAADMYAAIPNAYLWVVPDGGHVPITGEHAPRFMETVLDFFGGT